MKYIILLVLLSFASATSWAHSGRTNSSGCHNDYVNGGYHCHNSKISKQRDVNSEKKQKAVFFNTKSKKYHNHNCMAAKSCTVNCIDISKKEAVKMGGVPCGICGG